MSDQFSPVVYLIKSVMYKWILTKKNFRSLYVYEIEVILPSNLTEDLFEWKKTSEKGCYSLIIHTYFLVWRLLVCIDNWSYTSCQYGQFAFPRPRCYGDCMLLVKKTNVNSKNKQDPQSRYFCIKIQTFLMVFFIIVLMLIIPL